jgi:hypothetical protein
VSRAIEQITGGRLPGLSDAVSMQFLAALHGACASKQPIGKLAIVISPETACLVLRAELADRFHGMELHGFAGRIARHSTRGSEILVVVIGDDEPVLRRVPLGPVKFALRGVPLAGNEGRN